MKYIRKAHKKLEAPQIFNTKGLYGPCSFWFILTPELVVCFIYLFIYLFIHFFFMKPKFSGKCVDKSFNITARVLLRKTKQNKTNKKKQTFL